jgi:predicted component of type VI protein secretion system
MLFEMADGTTTSSLKSTIKESIEVYEPRALIQDIKVVTQPDFNSVNVTIIFQVVNSREQVTLSTTLSRLR